MILPARRAILRELAADAAGNLRALKGRTALALLGIAIGTAAVIAMLHIGQGARTEALRHFEAMGVDLVSITPESDERGATMIPLGAVLALSRQNIGIQRAAPIILAGASIKVGREDLGASVIASMEELYVILRARLLKGRFTSSLDGSTPFAVIGSDLTLALEAATGKPLEIGDFITVNDQVLTVVGLLSPLPANAILGLDANRSVIIPIAAARRFAANPRITSVAAQLSPGANDEDTSRIVAAYFRKHVSGPGIHTQTARQMIVGVEAQMRVYSLLLLAIGSVSLLVGGVGVMNVMLMSVMERRPEIGLRMAIGASRLDIRAMFIMEALILSGTGCVIGTGAGYGAGWLFAVASGWPFTAAPMAVPLAIGMAGVVGVFFGSYPANRAARLDPISALRSQ